ncbi:MAG: hypothetical protein ABIP50_00930 [Candidatus Saccharimonadales bacterium]
MQDVIPYHQLHRRGKPADRLHIRPLGKVVYTEKIIVTPTQIIEVDTITFEPTPMVRPIESLTPDEKVLVLERALNRARNEARLERRRSQKWRIFA